MFTDNIQNVIPLINNNFKNLCDSDLKREELQLALRHMKKVRVQDLMDFRLNFTNISGIF